MPATVCEANKATVNHLVACLNEKFGVDTSSKKHIVKQAAADFLSAGSGSGKGSAAGSGGRAGAGGRSG